MSRRSGPGLQIVLGAAVVGLFLYGFYSYHDVKTSYRATEQKADHLKAQYESASAQLQVLLDHKSRLEKEVQLERQRTLELKNDVAKEKESLEVKMNQEKDALTEELSKIKMEHDNLATSCEVAENDKQHLLEELKTVQEKCKKDIEVLDQANHQQQQEYENEVAQLKDEIANLRRRNANMEVNAQSQPDFKDGEVNGAVVAKNKTEDEDDQNKMQIAQPNDDKPKGYFEVKSPAPEDNNLVNRKLLPQAEDKQVAAPIVKEVDAGGAAGQGSDVGGVNAGAGANDGEGPEDDDNEIKDAPVGKDANDVNVINRVAHDEPEVIREEKNQVLVQVPAPAQKEKDSVDKQHQGSELGEPGDDEVLGQAQKPGRNIKPGEVEVPGQILKPGDGPNKDNEDEEVPNDDDKEVNDENPKLPEKDM